MVHAYRYKTFIPFFQTRKKNCTPPVHRSPGHQFLPINRDLFAHFKRTRPIRKLYKIACIPPSNVNVVINSYKKSIPLYVRIYASRSNEFFFFALLFLVFCSSVAVCSILYELLPKPTLINRYEIFYDRKHQAPISRICSAFLYIPICETVVQMNNTEWATTTGIKSMKPLLSEFRINATLPSLPSMCHTHPHLAM